MLRNFSTFNYYQKQIQLARRLTTQRMQPQHVQMLYYSNIVDGEPKQQQQIQNTETPETTVRVQADPTKFDYVAPGDQFYWMPTRSERLQLVLTGFYRSRDQIPDILPAKLRKRYTTRIRFYQILILWLIFTICLTATEFVVARYLKHGPIRILQENDN